MKAAGIARDTKEKTMFRNDVTEERFVSAFESIANSLDKIATAYRFGPQTASGDTLNKVLTLKRAGQVIEAIKMLRAATGLGLKESKDIVDAMPRF
jgi:ribosomal protein L7/L12